MKKVTVAIGDEVALTAAEWAEQRAIAERRHTVNASNNRGRGTDFDSHLKGVAGEKAVLKLVGLQRNPLALNRADPNPDITESIPPIEIKCGSPFVEESKIRNDCLYIVVKPTASAYTYVVTHMATGAEIKSHGLHPNRVICPRCPEKNLLVPIIFSDDEREILIEGDENEAA